MSTRTLSKAFMNGEDDGSAVSPQKIIDFKKVFRNAMDKGYESSVIESMQKRSAYFALTSNPEVAGLDNVGIQRSVDVQFLALIDNSGGFREAYRSEVKIMREVGRIIPEQKLELLGKLAADFVQSVNAKSISHIQIKAMLIMEARSTASVLRVFNIDDSLVSDKLLQNPVLKNSGVAAMIVQQIENDKKIGSMARGRSRADAANLKSVSKPSN